MDAATKQLVGDLRRAHASATNELTDWRVVLAPPVPQTRTLEFNTDGTMTFFMSPSGSACVTVDT